MVGEVVVDEEGRRCQAGLAEARAGAGAGRHVVGTGEGAAPPSVTEDAEAACTRGGTPLPKPKGEVLLLPWLAPSGRVLAPYLRALAQRVVAAVQQSPGVPEPRLLATLEPLGPLHARTLLQLCARHGLVSVRASCLPPHGQGQRRGQPGLLRFLGWQEGRPDAPTAAAAAAAAPTPVRHYFPVLLLRGGLEQLVEDVASSSHW